MSKYAFILIFLFFLTSAGLKAQEVNWISFEEALELSEKKPKKILVDIYTDWCGWCKKMDKEAYANEKIAAYINENFYAVKFDAEQKEPIEFAGQTFEYVAQGRRGVHELAVALTNNKLSYPTTVFLNEDQQVMQPIPGYMDAKALDPILAYIGGDKFKETPWEEFKKNYQSSL